MSPSLPPSLLAKLSPRCRWRGCTRDKSPDADWCPEHHERQKGYQRKSQQRINAARDLARECRACGGSLPKRWNSTRCQQCQREQAETAKSARLKDAARRLKNARRDPAPARGHYKSEPGADGTRTRYVGQAHRGGPTKVEQRAARLKLLVDAQRLFDRFREAVASGHPELDALPRIQRVEERARLAVDGTRAARLLLEAAAEEGCSVAPLWMRALAGDPVDDD